MQFIQCLFVQPEPVNSENGEGKLQKLTDSHDVIVGDNVEDETELGNDRRDNIPNEGDEESIIGIGDANSKESDEPFESFDDHGEDREKELKESILAALNELDTNCGVDVNEYLMQLQKDCELSTVVYDARLLFSSFFMAIIVIVAAIYSFAYRSVHRVITKYYINRLLPKNNADIRMVDLRTIIHRNQWIFGHIKTSGKGRTKMKILNELRSMQFA